MKTVNISYTRREFYNFFVERIKKEDGFFTVENKETYTGLFSIQDSWKRLSGILSKKKLPKAKD